MLSARPEVALPAGAPTLSVGAPDSRSIERQVGGVQCGDRVADDLVSVRGPLEIRQRYELDRSRALGAIEVGGIDRRHVEIVVFTPLQDSATRGGTRRFLSLHGRKRRQLCGGSRGVHVGQVGLTGHRDEERYTRTRSDQNGLIALAVDVEPVLPGQRRHRQLHMPSVVTSATQDGSERIIRAQRQARAALAGALTVTRGAIGSTGDGQGHQRQRLTLQERAVRGAARVHGAAQRESIERGEPRLPVDDVEQSTELLVHASTFGRRNTSIADSGRGGDVDPNLPGIRHYRRTFSAGGISVRASRLSAASRPCGRVRRMCRGAPNAGDNVRGAAFYRPFGEATEHATEILAGAGRGGCRHGGGDGEGGNEPQPRGSTGVQKLGHGAVQTIRLGEVRSSDQIKVSGQYVMLVQLTFLPLMNPESPLCLGSEATQLPNRERTRSLLLSENGASEVLKSNSCCKDEFHVITTNIMTGTRSYKSELRREQAEGTRLRILDAAARLLERDGADAGMTNRKVAAEAGVTEMTVYRHFPSRAVLDEALWRHINDKQGVAGGFPDRFEEMIERLPQLFASFDANPAHITSTVTTPTGREMRASQDEVRRAAFLAAVAEGARDLPVEDQRRAAAVLQLLYSAYAWISLREQWALDGSDASGAIQWAARTLVKDLEQRGDQPLSPPHET